MHTAFHTTETDRTRLHDIFLSPSLNNSVYFRDTLENAR